MNKKKLVLTIIIDMVALVLFFWAVYVLMFKDLSQWQSNFATALCVISLPVFFYSIFTQLTFKKYGDMQKQDEKRWDKEEEALKDESNNNE
ncbi:MAG: hypothetical protein IKJ73_10115 [Lachnospiraceae bacterium]|nr:hypothetical protein [Lachnospiraceae bacterium]